MRSSISSCSSSTPRASTGPVRVLCFVKGIHAACTDLDKPRDDLDRAHLLMKRHRRSHGMTFRAFTKPTAHFRLRKECSWSPTPRHRRVLVTPAASILLARPWYSWRLEAPYGDIFRNTRGTGGYLRFAADFVSTWSR